MLYYIKWFIIGAIDYSIYVLEYFHYLIDPTSYKEKEYYISFADDDSLPPLIDMTNDDILYEKDNEEYEDEEDNDDEEYDDEEYDDEEYDDEEYDDEYDDEEDNDDEEHEETMTCEYSCETEFEPTSLFEYNNHDESFFLKKSFIDKLLEIKKNEEQLEQEQLEQEQKEKQ